MTLRLMMSACTLYLLQRPYQKRAQEETKKARRQKISVSKIGKKEMSSGRLELSTSGSLVSLALESYYETSALPTELRRRAALVICLPSWPLYWVGGRGWIEALWWV